MATKRLLNNKGDLEEVDELEDSEVPEMGEEGILAPKNLEEMGFDDAESEEAPAPTETEEE